MSTFDFCIGCCVFCKLLQFMGIIKNKIVRNYNSEQFCFVSLNTYTYICSGKIYLYVETNLYIYENKKNEQSLTPFVNIVFCNSFSLYFILLAKIGVFLNLPHMGTLYGELVDMTKSVMAVALISIPLL